MRSSSWSAGRRICNYVCTVCICTYGISVLAGLLESRSRSSRVPRIDAAATSRRPEVEWWTPASPATTPPSPARCFRPQPHSVPVPTSFKIRLDLIAFCETATMPGADDGKGSMRKTMTKKPMISNSSDEKNKEEDERIVCYRHHWENCYGKYSGSFEDTTVVPPMRYTFGPIPKSAIVEERVQIFSVKVSELKEEEGVHWPLHVYGLIAVRDSMDPRRNFIFHRARDNCLTITEEDPFLLLTGPSHAVVILDPVSFEVQLKAKGESESEDKVLVFDVLKTHHAVSHIGHPPPINTRYLCGKRSKLEFTFAVLRQTVEATISVEVIDGSWPEDVPGRISTCQYP